MIVFCKPCHEQMESVWKEAFGEDFRCRKCGSEVSINYDLNTVSIDRREEGGKDSTKSTG